MSLSLSSAAVKGIAAVMLRANAGQRVYLGGLDITEMAASFLRRHVEEVGLYDADKAFRRHGLTLVTPEIGDSHGIQARTIGQPERPAQSGFRGASVGARVDPKRLGMA